jgi:hypothetical protein
MELDRDFKEFIQLLNANKVEYLVVVGGGYAVGAYGYCIILRSIRRIPAEIKIISI